jgi:hypothetical protein
VGFGSEALLRIGYAVARTIWGTLTLALEVLTISTCHSGSSDWLNDLSEAHLYDVVKIR